jgi:hypothetical protein
VTAAADGAVAHSAPAVSSRLPAAAAAAQAQAAFTTTAATLHYARGVAHAALGNVPAALQQESLLLAAAGGIAPGDRILHNNQACDTLAVNAAVLRGEILYRQGEFAAAFAALRAGVELELALPYDEPWGVMQPVTVTP